MSMFFAYMGGEGVGFRGFKMFVRGGQNYFLLALCVCGGGGGGGGRGRFSISPSVKRRTDPPTTNK